MIRICMGYDPVLALDHFIAQESIITTSSRPVFISPISLSNLKGKLSRERDPLQSNDFAFSRWLTPYFCNYQGWAIFMDSDMVLVDDIAKLWDLRDDNYAVQTAKHDYTPKTDLKFLNRVQTKYEKKNWSSVILFNNEKCTALTPEYVNTASGLDLHQFKWLENDGCIGEIPVRWNYLVGEYEKIELSEISLLHYTIGTPIHREYEFCDYFEVWQSYYEKISRKRY